MSANKHARELRFMAEWPPHAISEDERAAVLAGADAVERLEQVERQNTALRHAATMLTDQLAEVEGAAREFLEATSSSADTASWGNYAQRELRLARLIGYIVPGSGLDDDAKERT
jgi:hypothetical protein